MTHIGLCLCTVIQWVLMCWIKLILNHDQSLICITIKAWSKSWLKAELKIWGLSVYYLCSAVPVLSIFWFPLQNCDPLQLCEPEWDGATSAVVLSAQLELLEAGKHSAFCVSLTQFVHYWDFDVLSNESMWASSQVNICQCWDSLQSFR